jgi:Pyridoxamine 5'-phosphate oxidase
MRCRCRHRPPAGAASVCATVTRTAIQAPRSAGGGRSSRRQRGARHPLTTPTRAGLFRCWWRPGRAANITRARVASAPKVRRAFLPSRGQRTIPRWHHLYMIDGGVKENWAVDDGFDLDRFLGRPLLARVATIGRRGPTVRPLWYLWEEQAFWWLTGGWSKLGALVERDPRVALVVDTCDLDRGEVLQVTARGTAQIRPFDTDRARRWGRRYLGPDERHWRRFRGDVWRPYDAIRRLGADGAPCSRPVVRNIVPSVERRLRRNVGLTDSRRRVAESPRTCARARHLP